MRASPPNLHVRELESRLAPTASTLFDLQPGAGSSAPESLANVGGTLYFAANDGLSGMELWRSDGTQSGTALVRDINPGSGSSNPSSITNINGMIYFGVNNGGSNVSLWKSDGTSAGTVLVRSGFSNGVRHFTDAGGTVMFADFVSLWKTDGTLTGTISLGTGPNIHTPAVAPNGALIYGSTWMHKSDGTVGGTTYLVNPGPTSPQLPSYLVRVGNHVYFTASTTSAPNRLWQTDGTAGGTFAITTSGSNYSSVGDKLFYTVVPAGGATFELWKRDRTSSGTSLIRSFPAPLAGPYEITDVSGIAYFQISDGTTKSLWKSDGTSAGTVFVRAIPITFTLHLTNVGGALYFSANDGVHGRELWRSDGTSAGTGIVDDILPGGGSSNPGNLVIFPNQFLGVVGGDFYFAATTPGAGNELYRYARSSVTAITSTSPSGAYVTSQSINITLTFDQPVMLAGGNLNVLLDSGAVVAFAPFSGTTASATYTIGSNAESSPRLNVTDLSLAAGATLTGQSGGTVHLTLPISNLASNSNLLVNPPPPSTSFTVNGGAAQRSRLTTIKLNFANPVNVANFTIPGAIALTRTVGNPLGTVVQTGATGANGRIVVTPATGTTSILTLTFNNANGAAITAGVENGSLADGRWQLSMPYIGFSSLLNDPVLRRLFGDGNNDGTVDGNDLAAFGVSFGQTTANSPFDFDGNATIDAADYGAFGGRFGRTLQRICYTGSRGIVFITRGANRGRLIPSARASGYEEKDELPFRESL